MIKIKKNIIHFYQKLLFSISSKLTPLDQVVNNIVNDSKQDIMNNYPSDRIYGVFGKDEIFKNDTEGEIGIRLVQRIAEATCKELNSTVITGKRIYYKKGKKVKSITYPIKSIINRAKQEDKETYMTTINKILVHIPDIGVFLIDNKISASTMEQTFFHSRNVERGLGVVICNKNDKQCKHSRKVEIGKLCYHQCTHTDYADCLKPRSRCLTKKLKISRSYMQPFITKSSHTLIFTHHLKKLEKIIIDKLKN